MWTRTRRRVVEEEVTEVVSDDSIVAKLKEIERLEREERGTKYEQKRLHSFPSQWLDRYRLDFSDAQRLAKAGFYRWRGTTECFSCGLSKPRSFWRRGHDPETVHREESPTCKFITGQSDNVPIEKSMKYEQNRLDSFDSWWLDKYQLDISVAQRLAKAGFYYWGLGDTKCFSCGLSRFLTFWKEGHNPETVHRRESPNCKFITGQSDNVPIDNELQENTKTSTETSDPRVSGSRRFPISKSSKSKQNQEVRQPNDEQPKLHSGIQQLAPDTGAKPKRTVTAQEHVSHKNLTGEIDEQPENVSSYVGRSLFLDNSMTTILKIKL